MGERYLAEARQIRTGLGLSLSCGEAAAAKPQRHRGHVRNPKPVSLTRPRSGRAVSVRGDQVVKNQPPGESRRERLRTEAGGEVGRKTGLFTVPRILAFDDARGEITFERLQLENIRRLLSEGQQGPELLERIGRALAAIHGGMKIADGATVQRDPGADTNRQPVPLQGAFGIRKAFCWPRAGALRFFAG